MNAFNILFLTKYFYASESYFMDSVLGQESTALTSKRIFSEVVDLQSNTTYDSNDEVKRITSQFLVAFYQSRQYKKYFTKNKNQQYDEMANKSSDFVRITRDQLINSHSDDSKTSVLNLEMIISLILTLLSESKRKQTTRLYTI